MNSVYEFAGNEPVSFCLPSISADSTEFAVFLFSLWPVWREDGIFSPFCFAGGGAGTAVGETGHGTTTLRPLRFRGETEVGIRS